MKKRDTHGDPSCYNHARCRCDLCRAGMAKYMRERRLRLIAARAERGLPVPRAYNTICDDCGESHERALRMKWLRRFETADLDRDVIRDARSCWYPRSVAGERKLFRDLHDIKAERR